MKRCEAGLKGWYKMRLIDADKFLKEILTAGIGKTIIEYSESDIGYMIRRQPTVDAVEVVRCKDCKHYKEFRTKRNKQIMRLCCRMGKNDMEYSVKPDDFCSYGERSDENAAD